MLTRGANSPTPLPARVRAWLVLLALGTALPAAAQEPAPSPARIAEITRQLQSQSMIGGQFVQTRALHGLPRPLLASGRFVYWRDHGLYWETLAPFYQATTFTSTDLINWPEPVGPPQPRGPDDPIQQHVTGILLAVFSADLQRLEGLFESRWRLDGDAWTLTLEPANKVVRRVIAHATLSGARQLRTLTVASRAGDVNTMEFREVAALAGLPQALCERFAREPGLACPTAAEGAP